MESIADESRFKAKWRKTNREYGMNFKGIVEANVAALEGCAFMVPDFNGLMDTIWYIIRFFLYVVGIYGSQIFSEVVNMYFLTGDISEIVSASFLFLTHAVQIPKVIYLFTYMNKIKKLIKSINRPEFQPKSEYQRESLFFYVKVSRIITFSFWGACIATCIFWAIYPFTEDQIRLPLAGWFPFNITGSPNFECAFAYQFIAATLNGLSNISIDTLMSGLIMVICAQLHILNDSLINIRHFAELELKHDYKKDNCQDEISRQLQYAMNRKLIECIVHHRQILEFAKEFQTLFSNSILGQFVVSVIIICLTMFEMTLTPVGSLKFFSMVLYQYCMLLEIFLWCYFGNEVIVKSNMLTVSAYQSSWVYFSEELRKNLLFFMVRTQRGTKIFAGRFFLLSLSTFMKILKSSWSYFAVLMSINN